MVGSKSHEYPGGGAGRHLTFFLSGKQEFCSNLNPAST